MRWRSQSALKPPATSLLVRSSNTLGLTSTAWQHFGAAARKGLVGASRWRQVLDKRSDGQIALGPIYGYVAVAPDQKSFRQPQVRSVATWMFRMYDRVTLFTFRFSQGALFYRWLSCTAGTGELSGWLWKSAKQLFTLISSKTRRSTGHALSHRQDHGGRQRQTYGRCCSHSLRRARRWRREYDFIAGMLMIFFPKLVDFM